MALLHLVVFLPHAVCDDAGRFHSISLRGLVGIDIGDKHIAGGLDILAGRALKAHFFFLSIFEKRFVTLFNSDLGAVLIAGGAAVGIHGEEATRRGIFVVLLAGIVDG